MDGSETFTIKGKSAGFNLLEFWSWAMSDIYSNTTRGIIAEFLVAKALGLDTNNPRDVWAKHDLKYQGEGIEVKSTAYHQSWEQDKISHISFAVTKTHGYEDGPNEKPKRHAQIYVLCLLSEMDRDRVNPLDVDQWRFWIVPTLFFDQRERS